MTVKRISLGRLSALPHGRAKLVIGADGRRYACVRRPRRDGVDDAVDVLDDRCPHEGHPLSMGVVRDGVLTCQWHNWKFELANGACTFGGEGVRRYETEVWNDEVFVDPLVDADAAERRFRGELAAALRDGKTDAAVRVALRWAHLRDDEAVVRAIAAQLAGAAPHGLGDALPAILTLPDLLDLDEAERWTVVCAVAAEELRGREERLWPSPLDGVLEEPELFLADLVEERPSDAVGRVLGLAGDLQPSEIAGRWILPFLSTKVWSRGDALLRVGAALVIPSRAVLASAVEGLAWAIADSDLPPWRLTRNALLAARAIEAGEGPAPAGLADALLGPESAAIPAATHALEHGAKPRVVLEAVARAGVERLSRYDVRWSTRIGSTATALDAARPLLFARAALSLVARGITSPAQQVALAIQGAALAGKLAARDLRAGALAARRAEDFGAVVRRELLREDRDLARRVIVLGALRAHAHEHPDDEARVLAAAGTLLDERSCEGPLGRLAGNAARHVATGEPPTDGD